MVDQDYWEGRASGDNAGPVVMEAVPFIKQSQSPVRKAGAPKDKADQWPEHQEM